MVGTNTGYIRMVRMPTEEEDNPDHHLGLWMTAQQKLMRKLKGRRLAKEQVNFQSYVIVGKISTIGKSYHK